jgi:hypothetical protein
MMRAVHLARPNHATEKSHSALYIAIECLEKLEIYSTLWSGFSSLRTALNCAWMSLIMGIGWLSGFCAPLEHVSPRP